MSLEINPTRRFKAELAVLLRRGFDIEEFVSLQYHFAKGGFLPEEYGEHRLTDDWEGYWDCHLAGDLVLIYRRTRQRVTLVRIGTHDELFSHRKRQKRKKKGFWRRLLGR